jgi:hypothetical protein
MALMSYAIKLSGSLRQRYKIHAHDLCLIRYKHEPSSGFGNYSTEWVSEQDGLLGASDMTVVRHPAPSLI